ncbi:MAG: glycosyltransferase [Lachnospiraceae bacterium]|nr:glycosyltransferase [Lachnospiraceae bacterium]
MKLLIYRWNAWNQKDIEESLCYLGHKLSYIAVAPQNPEEDNTFIELLIKQIHRQQPELLFSINYFPVLAEACHQTEIPYVCWNCDGSLLAMYHESVFYDTNHIFTFDRECVTRFRKMGVSRIWHLPLGVNARRLDQLFSNSPIHSQNPICTDNYNISFIGNLYTKNSFDDIADKLPPYLAGYLDGALSAQQAVSGGNMLEQLLTPQICQQLEEITQYHRSERSFADIRQLFSSTVLGFKSANLQRCQILNALSKAGRTWSPQAQVHLFTMDSIQELPLVQQHPSVDYFQEMPFIFRHSSINLNSTVPTIQTGIPLRVWDVLGCGGFLLSDYQAELGDYFQSEKHLSVFEDTEELLDKAAFYLAHDEIRQNIASTSQKLVCTNHTWDIRLSQMFHQLHLSI